LVLVESKRNSRFLELRLFQVFCAGIPRLPGVGKDIERPPRFIGALLAAGYRAEV
jgi:hypothetical protein